MVTLECLAFISVTGSFRVSVLHISHWKLWNICPQYESLVVLEYVYFISDTGSYRMYVLHIRHW